MRYDASKYFKRSDVDSFIDRLSSGEKWKVYADNTKCDVEPINYRTVDIDGMKRKGEEMSREILRLNQKVEELETLLSFVIHNLQTGHDFASCDSEFLMELDSLFLNGGVCN